MTTYYYGEPEAALHYSPRLRGLGFSKLWGFCLPSGAQQARKAADTPQLQIHPSCRYTRAPHTPQLMASPVAAAPQGRSNTNSTKSSSSSNKRSDKTQQTPSSSPPGTVFYQWIVSPLCDSICSRIPPWVHPDIISFLGLCCTSASAYCCCAATNDSSGSQLALAALLWILYGLLDNIDGKQARRLGLCSAGGDFFDHSSDSVSSSFAALLILHMLCSRAPPSAAAAASVGQQQECVSLAFLRYIPGLSSLLPDGGLGFRVCFQTAETLNIHPTAFHVCFVLLSQAPFFIATWAHPIVGRTMLSASIDGTSNFSVDELNLLLIPALLLLKAQYPWVFFLSLSDAVAAIPVLGTILSPSLDYYLQTFKGVYLPLLQQQQQQQEELFLQQQQQQLTLGICVLVISAIFSIVESTILLKQLMSAEHLPRFLPGVAFFMSTFWFSPPLGLQIICFSLLCLELIAARLKLHVRSLLYLWFPVLLYTLFCLCLSPPIVLQQLAADAGLTAALKGNALSPYLLSRMLHRVRRSYELHEIFAVSSFAVLFCCLFVYKHIINRRNHPRRKEADGRKQD